MPKAAALVLNDVDNVAVALEECPQDTELTLSTGERIVARELIAFAHKVSRRPIAAGEAVLKYGAPIAFATRAIEAGEWVHGHNTKSYFAAKREAR